MSRPAIWIANHETQVADLLLQINRDSKTILVVVTHSAELAGRFPKSFELIEGEARTSR